MVLKLLRFSNYVTLPKSQGITKTAGSASMDFLAPGLVIKPNITCSVQKPQAMHHNQQAATPIAPGPCTVSHSWRLTNTTETFLRHSCCFCHQWQQGSTETQSSLLQGRVQSLSHNILLFILNTVTTYTEVSVHSPFPGPSLWGYLCPDDSDQVRATTQHRESLLTTSLCLFEIKLFLPHPSAETLDTQHYQGRLACGC